jgi:radical SAM protein with 4Fe4S-binding SPASM domain
MKLIRHALPLIFHHHLAELTFFVTSRCNYRCRHCFMLDKLNNRDEELSLTEVSKMAKYIRPLQRVHIGGGEPFLRKDISQIIGTISRDWDARVICLPTNGSIRQPLISTVQNFAANCQNHLRLHFSLNTLEQNFQEFSGTKDTFQEWEETFRLAKSITDQSTNITLLTLMTFNDHNQAYFENLIDYVTNSLCPDDVSIGLVRPHKTYNPVLDIEKYRQLIKTYFSETSSQNLFLKAYRTLIREHMATYYLQKRSLTKCYSGKMRVVMSPEGNIYPCETRGYPEGDDESFLLGNIRDFNYNIRNLLKSPRSQEVLDEIKNRSCHCSQGIDLSLSLLCSHQFKLKLLKKSLMMAISEIPSILRR